MRTTTHLLAGIVLLFPHWAIAQPLVEVEQFGSDPGNLRMFVHVPSSLPDTSIAHPLVVVLHGCSQSAAGFAEQSGWNELADRVGFYVIYPQQRTGNNASHCFNWFQEKDITRGSGEVESIHNMVKHAERKWAIDTSRIHVMGVSAGAAMAVAMGACYPETFSAVASFAGGPYKCALGPGEAWRAMRNPTERGAAEWGDLVRSADNQGQPVKFPRMVILHGLQDKTVDPSNALALVDQWCAVHGMDNAADSVSPSFLGHANVERQAFMDATGNSSVVLYRFSDLGHALPVDPGLGPTQGGHTGVFAVDKNVHATYLIAGEFGLVD